jgi:hypothetical protein
VTTAKPNTGRPKGVKQDAETIRNLKAAAIAAAETAYHYRIVARAIGRDEDTLIDWRKKDPEFSERLEEARFRFLNKQIRKAKPEFLLERLEPEIFKQRTDITSNDKPLASPYAQLTAEDLRKLVNGK